MWFFLPPQSIELLFFSIFNNFSSLLLPTYFHMQLFTFYTWSEFCYFPTWDNLWWSIQCIAACASKSNFLNIIIFLHFWDFMYNFWNRCIYFTKVSWIIYFLLRQILCKIGPNSLWSRIFIIDFTNQFPNNLFWIVKVLKTSPQIIVLMYIERGHTIWKKMYSIIFWHLLCT